MDSNHIIDRSTSGVAPRHARHVHALVCTGRHEVLDCPRGKMHMGARRSAQREGGLYQPGRSLGRCESPAFSRPEDSHPARHPSVYLTLVHYVYLLVSARSRPRRCESTSMVRLPCARPARAASNPQARAYHEKHVESPRTFKHARQWINRIEQHMPAPLLDMSIDRVTAVDLLD